jgi:serine protease AprX
MINTSPARDRRWAFVRRLLSLPLAAALFLSAGPAFSPALASQSNRAHLDRSVIKQMSRGSAVPVIVVARGTLNRLVAELHRNGIRKFQQVPIAHGVAVSLTPAWIDRLASDPNVERIAFDAPVRLSDSLIDATSLASVYPYAVDAVPAWSRLAGPLTGQGMGVAVIDSGIASHPDLDGRVVVSVNFNPNVADADDAYGHGTAVAGIIGGNGTASGGQFIGIAPQVNLINLRVNDGTGAAPTSAIMNAILWAVRNRDAYNIRVINLSLQASIAESYQTSPLDAAVEYAWLKGGIVVVTAAGNGGANSMLYAPANDPYVITVGATDDRGTAALLDDIRASFSSYGVTQDGFSKPDLVAPGRRVVTTLAPQSSFASNPNAIPVGTQYVQLSGTSMAAPQVSGAVALYLEQNPTTRPGQVKALFLSTARSLSQVGTGAGYPDTAATLSYLGLLGNADHGLHPNNYLQVMYLQAKSLTSLVDVSWDSVSWSDVSWSNVSWSDTVWDLVSWSN